MRAPALVQAPDRGQHCRLDRFVKSKTVVGRVVESIFLAMRVVAEVVESRVRRDPLTQVVHAVEEAGQRVAPLRLTLLQLSGTALPPRTGVVLPGPRPLRRRLFLARPPPPPRPRLPC